MPSSSKPPSAARVSRTVREGSIAASRWLDSSAEAAGAMLGLGETAAWKGERRGEPVVLRAPSIRRHRRQLAQSTSPTPTPTAVCVCRSRVLCCCLCRATVSSVCVRPEQAELKGSVYLLLPWRLLNPLRGLCVHSNCPRSLPCPDSESLPRADSRQHPVASGERNLQLAVAQPEALDKNRHHHRHRRRGAVPAVASLLPRPLHLLALLLHCPQPQVGGRLLAQRHAPRRSAQHKPRQYDSKAAYCHELPGTEPMEP